MRGLGGSSLGNNCGLRSQANTDAMARSRSLPTPLGPMEPAAGSPVLRSMPAASVGVGIEPGVVPNPARPAEAETGRTRLLTSCGAAVSCCGCCGPCSVRPPELALWLLPCCCCSPPHPPDVVWQVKGGQVKGDQAKGDQVKGDQVKRGIMGMGDTSCQLEPRW